MGRTRTAWIVQWAIPYGLLLLIEGASVHDCQAHKYGTFTTPHAWQESARTQCRDVDLPFGPDRTPWLERIARDEVSASTADMID
jgi:hypothetical protein